jgi:hypothetical protein
MSSQRKIRANRANARASTGPPTAPGKARVARNARRHGLAMPVETDATLARHVEQLAQRIAGPDPSPQIMAQARRVAEAQTDLVRTRQVHRALMGPALTESLYSPRKRKNMPGVRNRRLLQMLIDRPTIEKMALVLSDSKQQLDSVDRTSAVRDHDGIARSRIPTRCASSKPFQPIRHLAERTPAGCRANATQDRYLAEQSQVSTACC